MVIFKISTSKVICSFEIPNKVFKLYKFIFIYLIDDELCKLRLRK
jgi:hypothetical protein